MDELKTVGEKLTRKMESDVLMKVADHFSKRAEFCVQEKGGHFEHLKKSV